MIQGCSHQLLQHLLHSPLTIAGQQVQYITGRVRKPGQVNGKSENLNNALRGHVFSEHPRTANGDVDWQQLPPKELVVVFDADMRAKPDFFLKVRVTCCMLLLRDAKPQKQAPARA
jgi:hypothetical protein